MFVCVAFEINSSLHAGRIHDTRYTILHRVERDSALRRGGGAKSLIGKKIACFTIKTTDGAIMVLDV